MNTSNSTLVDVAVIGGGINGAGIARDLAGRGWSVVLCEKDDLAAHTSSASTKLIHGGLRYLEYYEFSLVRKALLEREVLLRSAPHIMWPLRFVMPHDAHERGSRPAWMIRAGLFLYDHLARREVLPGSQTVDLRQHPAGQPLQPHFRKGFVYSDGWVDDARLVVLNALDAHQRGAQILTRTACTRAERHTDHWRLTLAGPDGQEQTVRARALVNAAGPWAESFLREKAVDATVGVQAPPPAPTTAPRPMATRSLRLVKGSHIVVPRCFAHDNAYIFQNADGRIIFAIPYEQHFTLIGTTDIEVTHAPDQARISPDEISYLCDQASRYFVKPITPDQVVWSYSGVRPLLDDAAGSASAVTRDYVLEVNSVPGQAAPLLSVWGGKITTFRKLSEDAASQIGATLGEHRPAWTQHAHLPGGDLSEWIGPAQRPDTDFVRFEQAVARRHPWLDHSLRLRWCHAYGSRIAELIGDATCMQDLGSAIVPGVYGREMAFLRQTEWAGTSDDVLWRRSKLGLHLTAQQRQTVADWMQSS